MVTGKGGSFGKDILLGVGLGFFLLSLLAAVNFDPFHSSFPSGANSPGNSSTGGYIVTSPPTLSLLLKPLAGDGNVSDSQLAWAKSVLEARFRALDPATEVHESRDEHGNALLFVFYGSLSEDNASTLATTPGKFELRVQTVRNGSAHVLSSDDLLNVSVPLQQTLDNGSTRWAVRMNLSAEGARKFRKACIDAGAMQDPGKPDIIILLDDHVVFSTPLSSGMATGIGTKPIDSIVFSTGDGEAGHALARKVSAALMSGSLPVRVELFNTTMKE